MVIRFEIIKSLKKWQGIALISLVFFLLIPSNLYAVVNAPTVTESIWRTGEIDINYSDVIVGNTVKIYTRTWNTEYVFNSEFVATTTIGTYRIGKFENGQSVWFYLTQTDPNTLEVSPNGTENKQTPPITAFIINWQDEIATEIKNMFNESNTFIENYFNNLVTPSQVAQDNLKAELDNIKSIIGVGQSDQLGSDLQSGFDPATSNYRPKLIANDDATPYDGGTGGYTLPQEQDTLNGKVTNDLGLESLNPDSGTSNEVTIRIPYMMDMNGNLLYFKIFTQEQMDKFKWWGLLYELAESALWIMFAVFIVTRFTPIFKT